MSRFAKALIVSVVTALVGAGIFASVVRAEAGQFTAGSYAAEIGGFQTTTNTLSNGIRSVGCATASLATTNFAAASSLLYLGPSYANCTGNGNTTVTVDTEGCVYKFALTTKITATTGEGTLSILCSAGNSIVYDIWATGKSHSEAKLCRLELPEQGPDIGVVYHVVTAGSGKKGIEVTMNINTLTIERTSGTAVNCGAALKTSATWEGNLLFTATESGLGSAIDFYFD
ncbi:MAG: hypothetical protein QOE75_1090 [Solirubrobacterales bacterium]|jgi:hypothetical protein|nr:hypothetical protein [Solirubrobacterales bacterium]